MDNIKGNSTTIINFLALAILPFVSSYGIDNDMLVSLLSALVGLLFAYVNAKYPNTFAFLNNNETNESDDEIAEC